jgi:3-oxoacyl-[acyl-carrier protein] reductase
MAEAQALAGKVAIVTGAGKNIGKAIAQRLAADGAAVVVNGRGDRAIVEETAQEIRAAGGRAMPYLADVSKPDAVAGDGRCRGQGIRRGRYRGQQCRAAAPDAVPADEPGGMARDPVGGARRRLYPGEGDRAGDDQARRRRADRPVRHLASCRVERPHPCQRLEGRARRHDARPRDRAGAAQHHRQLRRAGLDRHGARRLGRRRARARHVREIPAGRQGKPEEIAAMVRFLVGPEGRYVTGQTIHVNGGLFLAK